MRIILFTALSVWSPFIEFTFRVTDCQSNHVFVYLHWLWWLHQILATCHKYQDLPSSPGCILVTISICWPYPSSYKTSPAYYICKHTFSCHPLCLVQDSFITKLFDLVHYFISPAKMSLPEMPTKVREHQATCNKISLLVLLAVLALLVLSTFLSLILSDTCTKICSARDRVLFFVTWLPSGCVNTRVTAVNLNIFVNNNNNNHILQIFTFLCAWLIWDSEGL